MNELQLLSRRIARLQLEFMHAKRAAMGTGRVKVVPVRETVVRRHVRVKHTRIIITR